MLLLSGMGVKEINKQGYLNAPLSKISVARNDKVSGKGQRRHTADRAFVTLNATLGGYDVMDPWLVIVDPAVTFHRKNCHILC